MKNLSGRFIRQSDHGLFRVDSKQIEAPVDPSLNLNEVENSSSKINLDQVFKTVEHLKNDTTIQSKLHFNPTLGNVILLIFFLFLILWIILANSLTILAVWRTRKIDGQSYVGKIYLANLAFLALLLGIFILPLKSAVTLIGHFPFNQFICDSWVFLDYYIIVALSFGNTAQMVSNFWMIRFPGSFSMKTKHHILVLFLIGLGVNLSWTPPFFNDRFSGVYSTGKCGFNISKNQYFSVYIGVTGLYLPLLISLICGIGSAVIFHQNYRLSRNISSQNYLADKVQSNKVTWKSSNSNHNRKSKLIGMHDDELLKPPVLKAMSKKDQRSFSKGVNHPDEIRRVAGENFPTVAACLVLYILCRGMFFAYFGIGSFVQNFFPPDLSSVIYWLMHSEAALSPIIHFYFDSELRHEILKILRLRNSRNSSIQPIITTSTNNVNSITILSS